ncbi:hypothetical protein GCM10010218_19970 [Streptomyces mashuensis]|uniref:Uncharacterized protein n=1 Tax=Streptomyces mashuensis TaxID=33904 RepID=A0A919B2Y8_9ACTN|nr:hypothetical protein [Streptomyces mashuensis]GHF38748.1 hypothetical protein GCM10010218_19970 [Streptomyces mashuensis]
MISFDPTTHEGRVLADLFRSCKSVEEGDGGWNGADVVDFVCDAFQRLGIDLDGPVEQVDAPTPVGSTR